MRYFLRLVLVSFSGRTTAPIMLGTTTFIENYFEFVQNIYLISIEFTTTDVMFKPRNTMCSTFDMMTDNTAETL